MSDSSKSKTDNHLYVYETILPEMGKALMQEIRRLEKKLLREQHKRELKEPRSIVIHLNSPGGDMFTSLALYDAIRGCKVPTRTIADGLAASGAAMVLVAGTERLAQPSAAIMIHQLSSWFSGTHEQTKDEMKVQKFLMSRMVKIFAERTGCKLEDIEELVKRDYWMDTKEAKKRGFISGLVE